MLKIHVIPMLVLTLVTGAASAQSSQKLTDQQRKFYETTLQVTKQEISDLSAQILQLQAKSQGVIAELQKAIDASKQMYAAACARLGIANDLDSSAPPPSGPPARLSPQQKKFYETTLQVTKQEIADLTSQIQQENASVQPQITELQNAINASKQMYAAACSRLGIPNDLAGH